MATFLGLLGMIVFIACAVALASGITWVVVKLTPTPGNKKTAKQS